MTGAAPGGNRIRLVDYRGHPAHEGSLVLNAMGLGHLDESADALEQLA